MRAVDNARSVSHIRTAGRRVVARHHRPDHLRCSRHRTMAEIQLSLFDQKPRRTRRRKHVDTLARRLFARVVIDSVSGCWNWTGPPNRQGYGQIRTDLGRPMQTHIVVWEMFNGPRQPDPAHDFELHHVCENKLCCRPNAQHVKRVRNVEHKALSPNSLAYKERQRNQCKNGHPYTDDNLIVRRDGTRGCLICKRGYAVARARKRAGG